MTPSPQPTVPPKAPPPPPMTPSPQPTMPPKAPPTPPMTRAAILRAAEAAVCNDRNLEYGDPEDNFTTIAALWETYLQARPTQAHVLDSYDVAAMMCLFKIARMANRPDSLDSPIDLAGYAACAGEIQDKMKRQAAEEPLPGEVNIPPPGSVAMTPPDLQFANSSRDREPGSASFDTAAAGLPKAPLNRAP